MPIAERVKIAQKTVKDSPVEKLYDGLINILCGAGGMVEVNKRVGNDAGLQRAFGRERCAEQSVIQEALDKSSAEKVEQMESAVDEIYQQHSAGYRHDYDHQLQILDTDMSGQPCGAQSRLCHQGLLCRETQSSRSSAWPGAGDSLWRSRERPDLCRHGAVDGGAATYGLVPMMNIGR